MNDNTHNDATLSLATAALRQTPILTPPSPELIHRAQQLPWTSSSHHPLISRARIAAAIAVLFITLSLIFFLQHSATPAFADVAQAVARTHTFTAIIHTTDSPEWRLFAKGDQQRIESEKSINIFDMKSGQSLTLSPSSHRAMLQLRPYGIHIDLYTILSEQRTATETSLGQRLIHGRKAQGYLLTRPELPDIKWTFWVDPESHLPIQVELPNATLTDLKFDIPLDDSLFYLTPPPGYITLTEKPVEYAGQVTNATGKPLANVEVVATRHFPTGGMQYIAQPVTTNAVGHFQITGDGRSPSTPVRLSFHHPDFLYHRLDSVQLLTPDQSANLHIQLDPGLTLTGRALDSAGNPLPNVMVQALLPDSAKIPDSYDYRKAIKTSPDGHFQLQGLLPNTPLTLQLLKTDTGWPAFTAHLTTDPQSPSRPLDITLHPVQLPATRPIHQLFGMKLIEIDDTLRSQLFLDPYSCILITDPGPNSKHLNIGTLQPCDAFWMVNQTRIHSFNDFTQQLLTTCQSQQNAGRTTFAVRIVYNFRRTTDAGSNTQYMTLTESDLLELQKTISP